MENKKPNRLIYEKSPYLLQHSYNPVDWYPWSEEAFSKAKSENKPIFLSIGYSTCHWCHVMEKESFEDPEVAELLNKYFVSIKVDREERPDIDLIYMHYCTEITGSGGWPLSCFLTPDKKPFFVGTYFPKHTTGPYLGFIDLLKKIVTIWKENSDVLIDGSDELLKKIKENYFTKSFEIEIDANILETAFYNLLGNFDRENGGFGTKPKFPIPHNYFFLLRYYRTAKQNTALEVVKYSLKKMRCGGIYDQIGYGFHRYSTDERWLLPHFEKMLYDQALMCIAYLETYQATGEIFFLKTALEIIEYVENNLLSDKGMFFSAEDADSEGMEGKFYLWTEDEIFDILGDDEYVQIFNQFYNIKSSGNFTFETGHQNNKYNILHSNYPLEDLEESYDGKFILNKFEEFRKKLLEVRSRRPKPFKDEKCLVDWNSLMIVALAKAYKLTKDENILRMATNAANFILENLFTKEKLLHSYKDSALEIEGFINDYVFFTWALLELFEIEGNYIYLENALNIFDIVIDKFWNSEQNSFNFSSKTSENMLFSMQEFYDSAIPSGNSVAYGVMNKLFSITHNPKYNEYAEKLERHYLTKVAQTSSAYTNFLSNFVEKKEEYYNIVVAPGSDKDELEKTIYLINNYFIPNKTIVILNEKNIGYLLNFSATYNDMKAIDGKTTTYICKGYTCQAPINSVEELKNELEQMQNKKKMED